MPGTDVVTTPPARDLVPAAAGPEVQRLAAAAAAYADAAQASNTRRAYESDWADFAAWCCTFGATPLPAAGATVAFYLMARAETHAVSTLERRMAAISTKHRMADLPPPASRDLRAIWAGIRRTHGRPPRQKRAIITEDLRRILAKLPTTTIGVRDRALILLAFAAALRRNEAAALNLAAGAPGRLRGIWLSFVPGGMQILIDHSKADQEGEGAVVAVPYGRSLCPVQAMQAWLELAQISTGPVFRPVDKHGRIAARAMSDKAIADVVKRAAARAKIDPRTVGGHSLRAGLVTQAIINGVAVTNIMKQTRHAKVDTLNGYARTAGNMKTSAAGKVGL
jgi:site-specific recombinase XerD